LRGGAYDIVPRHEAGVLIWWAVALGVAFGFLPTGRLNRVGAGALLAFGALVAWTALSFLWAESDERAGIELARTVHHAGLFTLACLLVRRETLPGVVVGVFGALAVVCLLAIGARLFPATFPVDPVREEFGGNRINYPLNYWNAVSSWAAITIGAALALSAHTRAWWARGLALAIVPVAALAAYLAYSRGGIVGTAAAVVVVLAASRARLTVLLHAAFAAGAAAVVIGAARGEEQIAQATGGAGGDRVAQLIVLCALALFAVGAATSLVARRYPSRPAPKPVRIGVLVAIALPLLVVGPGLVDRGWENFRTPIAAAPSEDPAARLTNLNGLRYPQFASAVRAWEAERGTGIGPGSFEFWWSRDGNRPEFIRDTHNLYLETLAELGTPGGLLLALLCAALVGVALLARPRDGTLGEHGTWVVLVCAVLVSLLQAGYEWIWEATANAAVLLVLAGGAAGALGDTAVGRVVPRVPWRVAGAVVAVAAILVQLPVLASTTRLRDSQAAAARNDTGAATAAVEDAIASAPWAAAPYVQRGLLAETAGDLAAAERDVRRAAAKEPTNWRHPLLLARVLAEQDRLDAALVAYRKARSLRPASNRFAR
jgi:hypothetical protein